jgi:DNA-binding CsgD family transcriptional regulator
MPYLRHSDLRRFSDAVGELDGTLPRDVLLSERLLRTVAELVPVDRVSYNEVDRATGMVITAHSLSEPPSPALVASLNRHIHEHPCFVHLDRRAAHPPPLKLSDFLSQRQFRSLGLYSEHFRLYKIHYQLGLNFAVTPQRRISFGLNRGARDFSEEDRLLMTLLRRHLAAAYLRARDAAEVEAALAIRDAALASMDAALVLFDARGEIVYRTVYAAELLERYDRLAVEGAAGADPIPIHLWARRQIAGLANGTGTGSVRSASARLMVERQGRQLTAVLTPAPRQGGWHLLRLVEQGLAPDARALQSLGLGARQSDVLFWLARGKRNAEIAVICKMHPTTVSTHLRQIFAKLGVETRTAAAALAWEVISDAQNGLVGDSSRAHHATLPAATS